MWGEGSDSVALFKNLTAAEERAHVDAVRDWQRVKSDAGYGSITWPVEHGGAALSPAHEAAFRRLEAGYLTPEGHESVDITLSLIGPTILTCGTAEQQARYLRPLRRTDEMWCQLFSEPGAGSDLAGLSTRATQDGDQWVLNGQKVWTSGAQFADFGYIQTRTDPAAPKHAGLTALPHPDGRARRRGPPAAADERRLVVQRGVPHRRARPRHRAGRRRRRRLEGRHHHLGFERAAGATSSTGGGPDVVDRLIGLAQHLGRTQRPRDPPAPGRRLHRQAGRAR